MKCANKLATMAQKDHYEVAITGGYKAPKHFIIYLNSTSCGLGNCLREILSSPFPTSALKKVVSFKNGFTK